MRIFNFSVLIFSLLAFPADAQHINGFDPISTSSPIYDNFYRARAASMNFVREAEPRLPPASRQRAREVLTRISYVVAYSPTSNEGMKRCENFSYLYDKRDDEFYICPSMTRILSNPDEEQMTITAQLLIGWAHYRVSPNKDPCADSEFELTIMEHTSVGVLNSGRLENELEKCGNRLARFRPKIESEQPELTRRSRQQPESPSWGEVILGSLANAGNAYAEQKNQLAEEKRARDQRRLAEQQTLYQQRMQQVDAENAAEEARRARWQQQQSQQASSFSESSPYTPTGSQSSGAKTQPLTKRTATSNPIVSARFTHETRDGGVSGRVSNIIVYANNTGNVAIDCDVWLKGAFWNDRAGPGMGSDQSLSSIITERRNVIGLRPGERRQVMALSHHVAGSRFEYDGSCKTSFAN